MSPGTERIRQHVKANPGAKLTALLHHLTPETLFAAYFALKPNAAPGADGITWQMYGEELTDNLSDLHQRLHQGAYRATPVLRVEIPKPDGGVRKLGIAALEDKILQRAVADNLLNPIYESEFAGFSYGFRPNRSAHNALDALAYFIGQRRVNWIVEVDIKGFFDHLDREQLMAFLQDRIADTRILRLIRKWLGAGVLEEGLKVDPARGTPQGAPISPLLANVYLHNVLDQWFALQWRPQKTVGQAYLVRYADDFVLGFEHRQDAERFLRDLAERLNEYGLELHPEKTRLIEFGKDAARNRRRRGERRPETFVFLGLTHYCRTTRTGNFGLGRKPAPKRVRRTLKAIKNALRWRMHDDPVETGEWLGRVLRGWLGYYAVPTSYKSLDRFKRALQWLWLRTLRRRSQTANFAWERLEALCDQLWPRVRIIHPWPASRFAVKYSR